MFSWVLKNGYKSTFKWLTKHITPSEVYLKYCEVGCDEIAH